MIDSLEAISIKGRNSEERCLAKVLHKQRLASTIYALCQSSLNLLIYQHASKKLKKVQLFSHKNMRIFCQLRGVLNTSRKFRTW
jgi:hypothetical protein